MNWKKTLLGAGSTIKQAIKNLDESALQIVLVVSKERTLHGTITDGDVRRGLLRGLDLESSVEEIIFCDPLVVPPEISRDMALHLMRVNKIHQIPIVDEQRRVVGLHLWDEIGRHTTRPNLMVIMAGGKGTRLRPYTENCPKPLLPVAGKPILEHIIQRAKTDGFEKFVLAVHYLGHMIEEYFGNGDKWGIHIEYLREESPLGTAGALSLLNPKQTSPFIISNGDLLTDVRYGEMLEFHISHNAAATMAVQLHEWQHPFGVVKLKGVEIIGFEEKPVYRSHVNAGVYVLDPDVLALLSKGKHCDMPNLFLRLQEQGRKIIAYPMHEMWLDVGRSQDYEQANKDLHKLTDHQSDL